MPPLVGLFDRRLQPHLHQMQHLPITDPPCHARDQRRVRNRIEIFRYISVYDFGVPLFDRRVDGSNRIERASLGTVSIRRLIEVRFENRFEHQRRRGLDDPVADRRDGNLKLHLRPCTLGFGA